MTSIAKTGVMAALLLSCASPLLAAEGFLLVEQTVVGTNKRSSQVQLERDRMRAEMTAPSGETQIVIFDGPKQVLRVLNPGRKSYTEMTKADADRIAAVMAAVKEKVAGLPPEQRAQSEAMMGYLGGKPGATARPEYKKAGTDKVGKWTCDKYEGFRNGTKVSEVCTVEPKALGLTVADFEVSKQVAAFFSKMQPQYAAQVIGLASLEVHGFSGIPVRRIAYSGGKVQGTSEVVDIRRENFPDSSYEIPAGFQKQAAARPAKPAP